MLSSPAILTVVLTALSSPRAIDRSIERAESLYRQLDYDLALEVIEAVLVDSDHLDTDSKIRLNIMYANCLSIVGRVFDAEKAFRFVLRVKPDFDLPQDTPHKILAVFRKVQVEEKAILAQTHALTRQRQIAELALSGTHPKRSPGGKPIFFSYRLRDPRGIVDALEVWYRRASDPAYSSLALQADATGVWRAQIPASWTANTQGIHVLFYLVTRDQAGAPLITEGDPTSPMNIRVSAGQIEASAIYERVWFWVVLGAIVTASGVAGYVATRDAIPHTDVGTLRVR